MMILDTSPADKDDDEPVCYICGDTGVIMNVFGENIDWDKCDFCYLVEEDNE